MTEFVTPVGRLVNGHPMRARKLQDPITRAPKLNAQGQQVMEYYIGVAIPKGQPGEDWKATEWGQLIVAQAQADFPQGQHQYPTFAWKVVDGDSAVPNKAGKKPCDREGYAGHWVMHLSTRLGVIKSFHAGRYDPVQQIQNENEIKTGDYCRVFVNCRGNDSQQSPGLYLNPTLFELTRAGIEIKSDSGPDASAAFGGAAPQLPPGAQVDTAVAAPAPVPGPVPAPAPDFLQPVKRLYNGQVFDEAALKSAGWTPEQIAALPQAAA